MKTKMINPALTFGAVLLITVATASANVINGDFENGNNGFSSGYGYVDPSHNALWPEGLYTVDTNPRNVHDLWNSMGDHTTGQGKMMIVNGDPVANTVVWSGGVDAGLTVGQTYTFQAWVASIYPANVAELWFSVGNQTLGTLSPSSDGSWNLLSKTFTATTAFPTFSLLNANDVLSGNDFALDDISVNRTPSTQGVPDAGSTAALLGGALVGLHALRRKLAI